MNLRFSHEMAPNELERMLAAERVAAEKTLLELTPAAPEFTRYEKAWPHVLAKHVVRLPDGIESPRDSEKNKSSFFLIGTWKARAAIGLQNAQTVNSDCVGLQSFSPC